MYFALVSSRENSASTEPSNVEQEQNMGRRPVDSVSESDKDDEVFVTAHQGKYNNAEKRFTYKISSAREEDLDLPSVSDYQAINDTINAAGALNHGFPSFLSSVQPQHHFRPQLFSHLGRRHRGDHGSPGPSGSKQKGSLPGGGTDMTLSELQEMAARQQQQIESQQQILVAKEQRLKYLKQQEQKQQQLASENDRLRKLRDKVETQEMKLKKLRALRGQVEQQRASNGNLNYELESIKSLFNEKEKELAMAVAKVEEMTRQLEDIRSGRVKTNTNNQSPAAMAELEKLKKELMIRNKLNEQQNSKMSANRELLMKRKDELARMDNRIHELQTRLKKKRAENAKNAEVGDRNKRQQVNNNNSQNLNNRIVNRPVANVAPVESVVMTNDDNKVGFGKNDPKYQSLPPKFLNSDKQNQLREANNNKVDFVRYEADKSDEFSVPLVVSVENSNKGHTNNLPSPKPAGQPGQSYPPYQVQNKPNMPDNHPANTRLGQAGQAVPPRSGLSHFTPRPFGSTYSTSVLPDKGSGGVPNDQPHFDVQEEVRQAGSGQSSPGSVESLQNGTAKPLPPYPGRESSQNKPPPVENQQHLKVPTRDNQQKSQPKEQPQNKGPPVPVRTTNGPSTPPTPPTTLPLNTSNIPHNTTDSKPDEESEPSSISVSKGIQKFSGLIAQNQGDPSKSHGANSGSGGFSNLNHASAHGAVRSAPTYRYASKSVIANTYLGRLDNEALEKYQKNVLSLHRDLNANMNKKGDSQVDAGKSTLKPSDTAAIQDEEKDSLSPISSVSSPASTASSVSPASPSQQQNYPFDFPTTPPHADVASDKVSYKPNTPKNIRRRHSDSDNEEVGKALHKYNINTNSNKNVPSQENQMRILEQTGNGPVEIQATTFSDHIPETVLLDSKGNIVEVSEGPNKQTVNNNKTGETSEKVPEIKIEVKSNDVKLRKKSNLKSSDRKNKNRVSFDPLALLLDASLEGEVDLVRRCAHQVENVSASNDEGITALHNAICAGHYDIVTFLVEFGCDVNSPDSDGWTPLHCAASCNNLPMVKFLVEHGACIFATTISDQETAAEKCEEDEDGYDGCSEYLYSIQEKLGIINSGAVYAVFDYVKQNSDELDLLMGDKFIVLKKGDDVEKDWWLAKCDNKEGYIPKNLLGLTPRVIPQVQMNGEV